MWSTPFAVNKLRKTATSWKPYVALRICGRFSGENPPTVSCAMIPQGLFSIRSHTLNATSPPSTNTRRISLNARSLSGINMSTVPLYEMLPLLNTPSNEGRTHNTTWRSRSALKITDTELKVMAALAIMGFKSSPHSGYRSPAAIGTPTIL